MRIDFRILKNIEEWYGSDDFEVGSDVTFDLLSDDKFVEPYITLRFGILEFSRTHRITTITSTLFKSNRK